MLEHHIRLTIFSIIGNDTNAKNGSVTIISTKEGTDIPYSITTSDSWIRQVQTGQIWLEENTGAERTGTLTITQDETGEEIVITFIQDVKPVTDYTFLFSTTETDVNNIPSPYTATPFNVYIDSYTGSTKDNTVSATHSALPDWITGWASVDMGQGVIAYSGTTTENDTGSNRNATITFTQEGSGKIVTLHVSQQAGSSEFTFEDGSTSLTGTLLYNDVIWGVSGTSQPIHSVISKINNVDVPYTVTSNVSWLTYYDANTNNLFYINSETNESSDSRSGIITFTQNTTGKQITISLTQEGKSADVYDFEFYSPSGETDITINAKSSSGSDYTISNVKSLKNGKSIGYNRDIGCS